MLRAICARDERGEGRCIRIRCAFGVHSTEWTDAQERKGRQDVKVPSGHTRIVRSACVITECSVHVFTGTSCAGKQHQWCTSYARAGFTRYARHDGVASKD
jgi:hypothetical protein